MVLAVLGIGTWTSTTSFAADFQFSGPAAGYVNVESAVFTVTTGGGFNGNIRVQIEGAGLDATEVLNFKGSDLLQSFTIAMLLLIFHLMIPVLTPSPIITTMTDTFLQRC